MGQRLNIEICYDGNVLANAYYHWSAYTSNALGLLGDVIEAYQNRTEINPLRVAVEILQATGAGVDEDERKRISDDDSGKFSGIEFHDAIDRNEGLLAVTKKGIEDTRLWEEGRVSIDISTEDFIFEVLVRISNADYEEEWESGDVEKLPYSEFDFETPCSFYDFDKLEDVITTNPCGVRIGVDTVVCWIE